MFSDIANLSKDSMSRLICVLLISLILLSGCGTGAQTASPCSAPKTTSDAHPAAIYPTFTENSHYGELSPRKVPSAGAIRPFSNGPTAPIPSAARSVVLPSTLYMVRGETYRLEFGSVVSGLTAGDKVSVSGVPEQGSVLDDHSWQYTPAITGAFTLTLAVADSSATTAATATRPVVVFERRTRPSLRHLAIGDSITRAGGYVQLAVSCVLDGKTVGTRTYDSGQLNMEGRGGWTLQRYMARIAQSTGGDSPFLFPSGVDGPSYRGNTAFWQKVVASDPKGYDYNGFQLIARDWQMDGTYVFGTDGYPVEAHLGDVVVDPARPAGAQWTRYDGAKWSGMIPQPDVEFSFSKYVSRYQSAFADGKPTAISIMLGTVDFLSALDDTSWSVYKERLDQLITSIRTWNLDVPIILIGSPSGAPANMWSSQKVTGPEFNARITEHSRRLYSAFDTQASRAQGVYVISFLGTVAPSDMTDYVHPAIPQGHNEMGPWLAGILTYLITRGSI